MPILISTLIRGDLSTSSGVGRASTSTFALQVFLRRRNGLLPDIVLARPLRPAERTLVRLLHSEEVLCTDVMQTTQTFLLRTALPLLPISLQQCQTSILSEGSQTTVIISLHAKQVLIFGTDSSSSSSSPTSLYVSISQPLNSINPRGLKV